MSPEFQSGNGSRLTAFLLYATLLQRDPTTTERTQRIAQLQTGTTVADLVAEVIASSEFAAILN